MRSQRDSVHGLHSVPELMGCEGIARRTYLEAWPLIDERLSFGTRVKRPPNNPINCLISFLNGMTYAAVRHEIAKTHLNETLSFLHAPSSARSSLSLDLRSEEHTSELQSLMRISYAVLCLKKKNKMNVNR